jgi:hypothetical protein
MNKRNQKIIEHLILFLFISLPLLNMLFPHLLWENRISISYPAHSAVEAIGSVAAIFIGFISVRWLSGSEAPRYIFISLGFLSMGIFDLFHSLILEGHGFVMLHSLALLTGGVMFALVWLTLSAEILKYNNLIKVGSALFVSSIGGIIIMNRSLLPEMIINGEFTTSARLIYLVAGVLFLFAAIRIYMDYQRENAKGLLLLVAVAILSASAGLIFPFSEAWSDGWWFWHGLRLTAFLMVLIFIISNFGKTLRNYNDSLTELEQKHTQMLALFDGIDEVIYVSDPDTYKILYFNDRAQKLWGNKYHEKTCYEVLQNRTSPCPFCTNKQILQQKGKAVIWEFQNETTKDWFRCFDKAILWNKDKWVRFEMAININSIKENERKLKKNNAELEAFNKMAVGREMRMIELKEKINQLSRELGKETLYDTSFAENR